MNTNPDDLWLRRRHPSGNPGDACSGGGEAYRAWMGGKSRRGQRTPSGTAQAAAERGARDWPPDPRAARSVRISRRARLEPNHPDWT